MTTPAAADVFGADLHPGCPHMPPCPVAGAVNHDEAHVVSHDYNTGVSRLCNGVLLFPDTGELVPDDGPTGCHAEPPHRPEPRHRQDPYSAAFVIDQRQTR